MIFHFKRFKSLKHVHNVGVFVCQVLQHRLEATYRKKTDVCALLFKVAKDVTLGNAVRILRQVESLLEAPLKKFLAKHLGMQLVQSLQTHNFHEILNSELCELQY